MSLSTGTAMALCALVVVVLAFGRPLHVVGDTAEGEAWYTPTSRTNHTGRGVVIAIVDDGLEWFHPDIAASYDPRASFDFVDWDSNPMPMSASARHGTRCAGCVVGQQTSLCGRGVAPGARLGALRLIDRDVTDSTEAAALSFALQYIDIFSCSWGPSDDGKSFEGPGPRAQRALVAGITTGRGGLGSIYVFASGNGGARDDCNADGYVNSIYTIGIGGVSKDGTMPLYGEHCASVMAVLTSNGDPGGADVMTTDLHGTCTQDFSGTSAAAPLAAGALALVLEANPCLTWRDLQHLLVVTSSKDDLTTTWSPNAAGFLVSQEFGFGRLALDALVGRAPAWRRVPAQLVETYLGERLLSSPSGAGLRTIEGVAVVGACDATGLCIARLEHVTVDLELHLDALDGSTSAGSALVSISLVSPSNTSSLLLRERRIAVGMDIAWTFMSVRLWGEDPAGAWRVFVRVRTASDPAAAHARLGAWRLRLHGTALPDVYLGASRVPPLRAGPWRAGSKGHARCGGCPAWAYHDGQGGCRRCSSACLNGCLGPGETSCRAVVVEWSAALRWLFLAAALTFVSLVVAFRSARNYPSAGMATAERRPHGQLRRFRSKGSGEALLGEPPVSPRLDLRDSQYFNL